MENNNLLKCVARYVSLIVIIPLLFLSVAIMASCAKEPVFGSLTICETIDEETKEPLVPRTEFEFNVKEIYSTIKVENIKGDANYRFLWKNAENDAIVADITGKYGEGQKGFLSGWSSGILEIKEGAELIAFPGNYKVEFYHDGELKSSADFTIKKPVAKILQVNLAKEVSNSSEPLNTAQEFLQEDIVYACVQLDYLVPGDTVNAKWFDDENTLILESTVTVSDYYFLPSWISFSFTGFEENTLIAGNYNVEILLNNNTYSTYNFTVLAPEHQSGAISFNNKNIFAEAEAKYYFSIMYPDNWTYSWQEDNIGMNVIFTPPNSDEAISTLMLAINEGMYPTNAQDTRIFMDEVASESKGEMKQVGEPLMTEKSMLSGVSCTEYVYYFEDTQKGQFGLILSTFILYDKMYIWWGFSQESFYNSLNTAYYEALNSITFSK